MLCLGLPITEAPHRTRLDLSFDLDKEDAMAKCAYCKAETEMYEGVNVPTGVECSDAQDAKRNVRAILTQNLREATARASALTEAFNKIVSDVPSGIPHPDSTQRIHSASDALATARHEMMKAHNHLNDFLARGIVPDVYKQDI